MTTELVSERNHCSPKNKSKLCMIKLTNPMRLTKNLFYYQVPSPLKMNESSRAALPKVSLLV